MSDSPVAILHDTSGTEIGTATNPVRTNPTGTTAQPVTDNGGSLTVDGTVGISGSVVVTGPLTDAQLRATAVPVSGTVTANPGGTFPVSDAGGSLTVDGPLTDAQLRAATVPISGTVTANAGAGPFPVSDNGGSLTVDGPLTDAQLRATAVPISGTVTANAGIGPFPVSDNNGSLTVDGTLAISNFPAIQEIRIRDGNGTALADVDTDAIDGKNRLNVIGKVSITNAVPPPLATSVTLNNSSPLAIKSTTDTYYVIPDGKTFTVTQVIGGAEGDPSEKGTVVEVFYDDAGTLRILDRLYITGQTVDIYPDTAQARDGTALVGNAAGTKRMLLRRRRLSGSSQEVDAVLRGYTL